MNLGEKNYCPMKRIISIIADLVLIGVSCQNSADPQKLREKVMASPEFAALVDAYENRSNDLVNEGGQAVTSFKAEEEQKKLIDERNRQIRALLASEKKPSREEFEEAVREIDQSLGITTEMVTPAKTRRMKEALAALLEKFPEIREQNADFVKNCLAAQK